MRIRELALLRYGHFEDYALSFPAAAHDIHVVYGDNEAGKSTALRALGDALFGIPERTAMDFRFAKPKLRIGATLELDDESFSFVRRKGRGNTVIEADGNDILDGEKTLNRFLGGADRALFERMFLLDHRRLQSGSSALLAGGDAGEAMLASSAGLEGLHDLLESLRNETEGLWTPNRSMRRRFYIAKSALDAATKARREKTVEPREWTQARTAVDEARAAYEELQAELREKRSKRSKLDRIRRLHGDLTKLARAERELVELGNPKLLDEGAAELLRSARAGYNLIQGRIEIHESRIRELEGRVKDLAVDRGILSLAGDIEALNERRAQLKQSREDLPRLKVTRQTLEEKIAALARDLGWSTGDEETVAGMLPTRPLVERARALVNRHTKLTTERENLARQQRAAAAEKERAGKKLQDLPTSVDAGELRAALRTAREQREIVAERRRLDAEVDKRLALLANGMESLAPVIEDQGVLAEALLPDRDAVSVHRDAFRGCVSRLARLAEDARGLSQQIEIERSGIEGERRDIGAMSEKDLEAARRTRDVAWELLAARYIRGAGYDEARWSELFGEDATGERRYPQLVAIADEGADSRFRHAHDVGALASRERALAKLEQQLAVMKDEISAEQARENTLAEQWATLWAGCPISPPDPDTGLAWLDEVARCKALLDDLTESRATLERLRREETAACHALLGVLQRFLATETRLAQDDLDALIAVAAETETALQKRNEMIASARDEAESATLALSEADSELAEKDLVLGKWGDEWREVLEALGLDAATTPETLDSYLGVLEELRANTRELVDNVNDRIARTEGDLERYEADVRQLAERLGVDDSDTAPDALVTAFLLGLRESQANEDTREREKKTVEAERGKLEGLRSDQREHLETIARLAELAGTDDDAGLAEAASASDRRRALESQIATLTGAIERNGDGKPLADLRAESDGVDLDSTIAANEQLEEECAALEAGILDRHDALKEAEAALAAIGEHGEAARLEWERQQALADLGQVAERFVRTATASALLRWSIDRFRIRNQKPLLDRASILFALITRGSFERVVIEYDDDQPVLAGRRPDGEITSLDAMSSGSRDQLYLALRLAAVEDYAAKASAMPFVGDDLFIQHDKKRTREALTALTALSTSCQVILFSHDEAFLQLAADVLPEGSNLVEIDAAVAA